MTNAIVDRELEGLSLSEATPVALRDSHSASFDHLQGIELILVLVGEIVALMRPYRVTVHVAILEVARPVEPIVVPNFEGVAERDPRGVRTVRSIPFLGQVLFIVRVLCEGLGGGVKRRRTSSTVIVIVKSDGSLFVGEVPPNVDGGDIVVVTAVIIASRASA